MGFSSSLQVKTLMTNKSERAGILYENKYVKSEMTPVPPSGRGCSRGPDLEAGRGAAAAGEHEALSHAAGEV